LSRRDGGWYAGRKDELKLVGDKERIWMGEEERGYLICQGMRRRHHESKVAGGRPRKEALEFGIRK